MYIWLGFSPKSTKFFVRKQGLNSSERLRVNANINIYDVYNVVRTPGDKNANEMPNRGQQVSAIAHENLKLAVFLFYQRWRFTFDWEVTRVHEDTAHLLAGQMKLRDEYKDHDILPMANKAGATGMMEAIKEYLRSHCSVVSVPYAYVVRKTVMSRSMAITLSTQLLMMR